MAMGQADFGYVPDGCKPKGNVGLGLFSEDCGCDCISCLEGDHHPADDEEDD